MQPTTFIAAAVFTVVGMAAVAADTGSISISIRGTSGELVPARVHVSDSAGKPHLSKALPSWRDHFVSAGTAALDLPPGSYTIEVERGPEFSAHRSSVALEAGQPRTVNVTLKRIANLSAEGWWSGDLHVHRAVSDAELLMRAEDLHVGQFITWWNKENRWGNSLPANPLRQFDGNCFAHLLAGEDEREGGALLYFNLKQPLAITAATRHFPSSLVYAKEARKIPGVSIDMEKPFWWDLPIWVASGLCDTLGLANNHMQRSGMHDNEAWGRPRDLGKFPSPHGNGLWTQAIYYRLLDCGLRIPPSAGSASGVLPNPVGYNRVYVHTGPQLSYDEWWRGLRAGRSFVSNGPLLRCRANGKLPGEVFVSDGEAIDVEIDALLQSRDPVSAVDIVQDGRVVRSMRVEANGERARLGKLTFFRSGWFLVRVVAVEPKTFRFASTAPFYVEVGGKRRVSRAAAQFFLDWVKEGAKRIQLPDGEQKEAVLADHRMAEIFWTEKVAGANGE